MAFTSDLQQKFSHSTNRHAYFDLQKQIRLNFNLQLGRYSQFENKIKCPWFSWQFVPGDNCFLTSLCPVSTLSLLNLASRYWPLFYILTTFSPVTTHHCPQISPPPPILLPRPSSWILPREGILSNLRPGFVALVWILASSFGVFLLNRTQIHQRFAYLWCLLLISALQSSPFHAQGWY